MAYRTHQRLAVWQKGMDLVVECYRLTGPLPESERYGLTSQIRRAGVSIPANIAEGNGRGFDAEYARSLTVARGSLRELETHLEIARRLEFIAEERLAFANSLLDEVGRLLTTTIGKVRQRDARLSRRS